MGHGFDVHAFGAGNALMLGGVRIPFDRGLVAHSDGDVVIHALCDALLGAAGLGDIGALFPDTDAAHAGRDSGEFLSIVRSELDQRGLKLSNADITVIAQVPRLSPHVQAMKEALARLLDTDSERINIKATTSEGLGALGRSEGIAAHAVVLLEADG